ncbi:MAG: shikimate kinase [Clostridiales bacterium]|jgi:shikimate kinase|nr:shikimate kinase [Clostridiales bacterium]
MKNIIFIGFMCSGKSTIGRVLAKEIGFDFVDTDRWISNKANMTVGDIFKEKGEDYFRSLETQTIKEFCGTLDNTVISTGGGLPIKQENVPYLKELGRVVYLKVSRDTVIERLNPNIERPLLAVENKEEFIDELLAKRNPLYEQAADITIDTNNKSIATIVDEVRKALAI